MPSRPAVRVDRLGLVLAALLLGAAALPFATQRASRIAAGVGHGALAALPPLWAGALLLAFALAVLAALFTRAAALRPIAGAVFLAMLALAAGEAGRHLATPDLPYARVSPASGFWLGGFAGALLLTDALVRLKLGPLARLAALAVALAALAALLGSGAWSALSLLAEYRSRADLFWREAGTHLVLALGSLGGAVLVGVPLGVLAHRVRRVRGPLIGGLNIVQTIPSMALFGLMIVPLGWVAAHVPGAQALGIAGIGTAPALLALFLYALLPMVATTAVGLAGVPPAALDAARGMGFTGWQRLMRVEVPLALPVLLSGIRIVLVQNIGLASIAALIGGGGFGVFLFQGLGQTATDLILLGALPIVTLAFAAAVTFDALIALAAAPGSTPIRMETAA